MVLRTSKPLSALAAALTLTGLSASATALAGPREQANMLFNRLNGVPPSAATLDALTTKVTAGDVKGAAVDAINDPAGMFYNLTLKGLASQWTNTDGSPRVPLNDMTATVIGMVRDDVPFNTAMSADMVYVGDATKVAGIPAYSLANNAHYAFLDTQGSDLHTVLVQQTQSTQPAGIPAAATAGIITTRGFAEAYFKDGTNRRAASFTFQNFLCSNMNQLADTTRADLRVRRDVTRSPGGDSALYRNKCAGCHAGMDGMAGAFAYYDVVDGATADADKFVYNAGTVDVKFNRNSDQFPEGYVTTDDGWVNLWVAGQNTTVGWHGADSGNGAKAWGEMLTDTDAFATCMATTAVTAMCLHAPTTTAELAAVTSIADDFKKDYLMKNAFAEAAVVCTGE